MEKYFNIDFRQEVWGNIKAPALELARREFHPEFLSIGEGYFSVKTASENEARMSRYVDEMPIWIACHAGKFVGFLSGVLNQRELIIYDIFVDTNYRRKGIATELLKRAASSSGAISICGEVNQKNIASQGLFNAAGFRCIRTVDWFVKE